MVWIMEHQMILNKLLIAYMAIAKFGMDKTVGYINIDGIGTHRDGMINIIGKDHYCEDIDREMKEWMKEAEERTRKLVDKHWGDIEKLADLLIKEEIVYEEELNAILKV